MSAGRLEGLTAFVTGARGGIGRAIVDRLVRDGARVIAVDLTPVGEDASGHADHRLLDVTSESGWRALAEDVARDYGRLDILIHNAGIAKTVSLAECAVDDMRLTLRVNLESLFLGTQALLPMLREGGRLRAHGAAMITMASIGANEAGPLLTAYCATKGGAKMFSKACAVEFSALDYNIRCNSVCPGGVDTPMMENICSGLAAAGLAPGAQQAMAASIAAHPLGRLAQPDDIADAVAFLASDDARFIHGTELVVDGGKTAQ